MRGYAGDFRDIEHVQIEWEQLPLRARFEVLGRLLEEKCIQEDLTPPVITFYRDPYVRNEADGSVSGHYGRYHHELNAIELAWGAWNDQIQAPVIERFDVVMEILFHELAHHVDYVLDDTGEPSPYEYTEDVYSVPHRVIYRVAYQWLHELLRDPDHVLDVMDEVLRDREWDHRSTDGESFDAWGEPPVEIDGDAPPEPELEPLPARRPGGRRKSRDDSDEDDAAREHAQSLRDSAHRIEADLQRLRAAQDWADWDAAQARNQWEAHEAFARQQALQDQLDRMHERRQNVLEALDRANREAQAQAQQERVQFERQRQHEEAQQRYRDQEQIDAMREQRRLREEQRAFEEQEHARARQEREWQNEQRQQRQFQEQQEHREQQQRMREQHEQHERNRPPEVPPPEPPRVINVA